jgi:hypothetical protein
LRSQPAEPHRPGSLALASASLTPSLCGIAATRTQHRLGTWMNEKHLD